MHITGSNFLTCPRIRKAYLKSSIQCMKFLTLFAIFFKTIKMKIYNLR